MKEKDWTLQPQARELLEQTMVPLYCTCSPSALEDLKTPQDGTEGRQRCLGAGSSLSQTPFLLESMITILGATEFSY
jgi:hypothetical protein